MLVKLRSRHASWRVRGAVPWRLVAALALASGLVWLLLVPTTAPPDPEPTSRAVAGPIAVRKESAAASAVASTTVDARGAQNDPFAGVDLSNDSVLQHIAGIDEKGHAHQPPKREAAKTPSVATASPARASAAQTIASTEQVAEARPVPLPPAATAVAVAPPQAEAPRVAPVPQPPPVIEAPTPRAGSESNSSVAAPESPQSEAPAAPSPPAVSPGDRVLVAALGKTVPAPPSTAAPLRLANRTVPIFPVEAIRAGIQSGRVVARLTVEPDGRVSSMQIVSSSPLGYFERESRRALTTWRYEPPGQTTLVDVELVFNRE